MRWGATDGRRNTIRKIFCGLAATACLWGAGSVAAEAACSGDETVTFGEGMTLTRATINAPTVNQTADTGDLVYARARFEIEALAPGSDVDERLKRNFTNILRSLVGGDDYTATVSVRITSPRGELLAIVPVYAFSLESGAEGVTLKENVFLGGGQVGPYVRIAHGEALTLEWEIRTSDKVGTNLTALLSEVTDLASGLTNVGLLTAHTAGPAFEKAAALEKKIGDLFGREIVRTVTMQAPLDRRIDSQVVQFCSEGDGQAPSVTARVTLDTVPSRLFERRGNGFDTAAMTPRAVLAKTLHQGEELEDVVAGYYGGLTEVMTSLAERDTDESDLIGRICRDLYGNLARDPIRLNNIDATGVHWALASELYIASGKADIYEACTAPAREDLVRLDLKAPYERTVPIERDQRRRLVADVQKYSGWAHPWNWREMAEHLAPGGVAVIDHGRFLQDEDWCRVEPGALDQSRCMTRRVTRGGCWILQTDADAEDEARAMYLAEADLDGESRLMAITVHMKKRLAPGQDPYFDQITINPLTDDLYDYFARIHENGCGGGSWRDWMRVETAARR